MELGGSCGVRLIVAETVVDRLYGEFSSLLSYLEEERQISFLGVADESLRKALLMASASYFEKRLGDDVLGFVEEAAAHPAILALVKAKAVTRQYHTWFDWTARNANVFFRLFGEAFVENMKEKVETDAVLKEGILAFLEIGRERNRLVHEDYGSFSMEKTAEEIYQLHRAAMVFVDGFGGWVRELGS